MPPIPRKGERLVLEVKGRMLWAGSAAFPLHNITWVEAFKLRRDWGAAFVSALKWLVCGVLIQLLITWAHNDNPSAVPSDVPVIPLALIVTVAVFITDLITSVKPVLIVGTAGGTTLVLTLPTVEELRDIAGRIVYAIEHPGTEFTETVYQFISNHTNYFGSVVNMNGGRGNTGMKL